MSAEGPRRPWFHLGKLRRRTGLSREPERPAVLTLSLPRSGIQSLELEAAGEEPGVPVVLVGLTDMAIFTPQAFAEATAPVTALSRSIGTMTMMKYIVIRQESEPGEPVDALAVFPASQTTDTYHSVVSERLSEMGYRGRIVSAGKITGLKGSTDYAFTGGSDTLQASGALGRTASELYKQTVLKEKLGAFGFKVEK